MQKIEYIKKKKTERKVCDGYLRGIREAEIYLNIPQDLSTEKETNSEVDIVEKHMRLYMLTQ